MSGFNTSGLSDFTKDLLDLAQNQFPKETKKFLREEGTKLNRKTKALAKQRVKKKSGNYIKGFKRGKPYKHNPTESYAVRVYNYQPHAHLIEDGHVMLDHKKQTVKNGEKFVKGKKVLTDASNSFEGQFENDVEKFVDDMLEKGLS